MILTDKLQPVSEIGGKAYNLIALDIKNTPPLFVCPASYFEEVKLNPELKKQLQSEIDRLFSDKKLYAVRSSAVDEDSAQDSFAGVHESYLNIKKCEILENVEKVYKSAFTEKAIAYRRTRGLAAEGVKIAVVIQEMVAAEFAGVINTINPVTDNPDEIVISVTRGLGDKIVDGTDSGTTYRVNCGKISAAGEDILGAKRVRKVVELAREIAAKTDAFQDIEFAYKDGKVWFLQARAITTYKNINPHKRGLLIDNSNIAESFFGVVSPLTFSFAKGVYAGVYRAALRMGKVNRSVYEALSPALGEMLFSFEGKVYYNMNSWYYGISVLPFKKSDDYFEHMIGANSQTGEKRRVKTNLFDTLKFAAAFAGKLKNIEKLAKDFEDNFERVVMPYYGGKIAAEGEKLTKIAEGIERDITEGFAVPVINDVAVMYYFGKLKDKAKKLGISEEQINAFVCTDGGVKSTESASKLVEIVQAVKADAEIYNDFLTLEESELCKKYSDGTPVSKLIKDYIFEFGARVPDELKLETVTMIEDPTILYRLIKDNLQVEFKAGEKQKAEIPKKLKRLAEKAKKYMAIRERLRLKRTYMYSVTRNIFLAFGENFCAEGKIESVRDIFYLTRQEIKSGTGNFKEIIAERKAQEKLYLQQPTNDRIVFFDGVPLPVKSENSGAGLHGIPSGNGTVCARVSLMESPDDKLVAGNIILTKRTDPGWISLFPLASGLIVEHGSMLSHSFVVARELNLPAVVGLKNATALIPDGSLVLLDGLSGEVKILE